MGGRRGIILGVKLGLVEPWTPFPGLLTLDQESGGGSVSSCLGQAVPRMPRMWGRLLPAPAHPRAETNALAGRERVRMPWLCPHTCWTSKGHISGDLGWGLACTDTHPGVQKQLQRLGCHLGLLKTHFVDLNKSFNLSLFLISFSTYQLFLKSNPRISESEEA